MKIDNNKVTVSSVNMQERKELGIKAGDNVRVWQKIEEKGKTRLQAFEGVVLATKHGSEAGATFTVRKVASGVGVEKVFPLFSPMIDKIEITKRTRIRRAKLYILRDKVAREMKRILRRGEQVSITTKGGAELDAERKLAEAKQKEIDDAQAKLEAEAAKKAAAEKEEAASNAASNTVEVEAKTDEKAETEEAVEKDDLTKIEGIGPKISEVLNKGGITTFAQLADAKDEDTQEMIKEVKGNHQAGSWNEQAALARDGGWDELKDLQDKLNGGVADT
jgi:ribosomal protein L19